MTQSTLKCRSDFGNDAQPSPFSPATTAANGGNAGLYHDRGEYDLAEPLYKRALAIREKALGPGHPGTARSLNNLATLYGNQGKYDLAEPLYKRALAIEEKALGPDHPSTVATRENLKALREAKAKAE